LQKLVAREHEFADQIHQSVEQIDANAYGFHSRLVGARFQNVLRGVYVLRAAKTQRDEDFSEAATVTPFLFLKRERQIVRLDRSPIDE
jgi:hypothetical protein